MGTVWLSLKLWNRGKKAPSGKSELTKLLSRNKGKKRIKDAGGC